MSRSVFFRAAALAPAVALVAACSPTFNWREVPVGAEGLVTLMPCKPDRARRAMPLGAESVTVDMAGCQAGDATFAVAHAMAANPTQAESWMRAWRAATRAQLAPAAVAEAPATLPRASVSPMPIRLDATGGGPDAPGTAGDARPATPTHILWFAQQRGDRVALYQATLLGRPSSPEAEATFFEGLRLP